ncbi:uncharacterized protein IAS62_000030 [Cryptococcus decagattii]|uniref:Uncharacterized protein n=1 Tax=Cryptococcus decagattii TaxID=1859122 RepID=A0ABZ2AJW4_9TREE
MARPWGGTNLLPLFFRLGKAITAAGVLFAALSLLSARQLLSSISSQQQPSPPPPPHSPTPQPPLVTCHLSTLSHHVL